MNRSQSNILRHATDLDDLDEALHPSLDAQDGAHGDYERGLRDAGLLAIEHWKLASVNMRAFKGNPLMAIICNMVAHGWWSLLSQRDQVEIADFFGCERANINKLVKLSQKRLGLPPTLGQRRPEGCDNMSATRKRQLSKTGK